MTFHPIKNSVLKAEFFVKTNEVRMLSFTSDQDTEVVVQDTDEVSDDERAN